MVGEVGEGNLGLGALDADGADEQAHLILLPGEDMLNAGADFRFGGVRLCCAFGHGLVARLLAVNAADPALPLEPCLVGLAAVGGVRPDVGSSSVASEVTTSRSILSSKRAPSVTLHLRMKPKVRQIDTLLL